MFVLRLSGFILGVSLFTPLSSYQLGIDFYEIVFPGSQVAVKITVCYELAFVAVQLLCHLCDARLPISRAARIELRHLLVAGLMAFTILWSRMIVGSSQNPPLHSAQILLAVVTLNGALDGLSVGAVFGEAAILGPAAAHAVVAGTAGVMPLMSCLRILFKGVLPDTQEGMRLSIALYFAAATVVLLASLALYAFVVLPAVMAASSGHSLEGALSQELGVMPLVPVLQGPGRRSSSHLSVSHPSFAAGKAAGDGPSWSSWQQQRPGGRGPPAGRQGDEEAATRHHASAAAAAAAAGGSRSSGMSIALEVPNSMRGMPLLVKRVHTDLPLTQLRWGSAAGAVDTMERAGTLLPHARMHLTSSSHASLLPRVSLRRAQSDAPAGAASAAAPARHSGLQTVRSLGARWGRSHDQHRHGSHSSSSSGSHSSQQQQPRRLQGRPSTLLDEVIPEVTAENGEARLDTSTSQQPPGPSQQQQQPEQAVGAAMPEVVQANKQSRQPHPHPSSEWQQRLPPRGGSVVLASTHAAGKALTPRPSEELSRVLRAAAGAGGSSITLQHLREAERSGSVAMVMESMMSQAMASLPEEPLYCTEGRSVWAINRHVLRDNAAFMAGTVITYACNYGLFPAFIGFTQPSAALGTWYSLLLVTTYGFADLAGKLLPLWRPARPQATILAIGCARLAAFFAAFAIALYFSASPAVFFPLTALLALSAWYEAMIFSLACEGRHPDDAYVVESLLAIQLDVGIAIGSVLSLAWSAGPWAAQRGAAAAVAHG